MVTQLSVTKIDHVQQVDHTTIIEIIASYQFMDHCQVVRTSKQHGCTISQSKWKYEGKKNAQNRYYQEIGRAMRPGDTFTQI